MRTENTPIRGDENQVSEGMTFSHLSVFDKPLPFLHHDCSPKQRNWACGIQKRMWVELQSQMTEAIIDRKNERIELIKRAAKAMRHQVKSDFYIKNKDNLSVEFLAGLKR